MGLLDQFSEFAKTPEGQGLLSAAFGGLAGAKRGQPLNSIGRAGLAGLTGYSTAIDRQGDEAEKAFQRQYRTLQMSKLEQDVASDKARQSFLSSLTQAPTAALAEGAATGDVGPTKTNAARMPAGLSRIPQDALLAEISLNGGKNLPEWMFKTGTPDMQVSNGYAYNKNELTPGFLPGLVVSNDGKATQTMPDPVTGQPVISAPKGALDLYGSYRTIDERTKAGFDPMPVTSPTGQTTLTTRGAFVDSVQPRPPQPGQSSGAFTGPGYAGGSSSNALPEQLRIIKSERDKAAAGGRSDEVAALDREIARLEGGRSTGGAVPGIQVQSEGQKLEEAERVKAASVTRVAAEKDRVTARKFLNQAKEAERLLNLNPTGSLGGSLVDKGMGMLGLTTDSANLAQQLKAVSGWLVSNVPRMEGPQSNFDVDNYKTMAADVGNDQLPVARRMAAVQGVMKMLREASGEQGGQTESPPKSAMSFDAKPPAHQFRGKTMTGPDGKRYKSDGMIWKEVQ